MTKQTSAAVAPASAAPLSMFHTTVAALLARLGLACALATAFASSAHAQVRLRQIYGGGGTTGALYTNDFVELHNYGAPQSLAGWSVQVASAAGATWSVAPLPSVVLGSSRSYLLRLGAGGTLPAGQSLALPAPDATSLLALNTADGKVALVSSIVALSGAAPSSPAIVDLVGYGPLASWNEPGAPFGSGANATSPSNEHALVRWKCAAPDSDVNSADWAVALPAPRNSLLAPVVGLQAAGLCSPHLTEAGRTVRLSVEAVTCAGERLSPAASVSANLSALGGSASFALNDLGLAGDLQAADGVWSASVAVGAGTPNGPVSIVVTIADGANSTQLAVGLEVRAAASPDNDACREAQALGGPLPVSAVGVFSSAASETNPLLSASATLPPGSMGARRGRWYSVVGTGATMSASTCASPLDGSNIPDTVLMVLCGSCDALSVVAFNDDLPALCGAGSGVERRSQVSWCSTSGVTYWIWVAPFVGGAQGFGFALDVWDDGVACSSATSCATCAWLSPGELEHESGFGPALNDGCDARNAAFVEVVPAFPAERWVGKARQWGAGRDHDWYRFQSASGTTLSATLTAQFHGQLEFWSLSPSGDCAGASLISSTPVSARCGAASGAFPTVAGEWYAVRVVPQNTFAGAALGGFAPGGDGVAYALDLELPSPVANDLCANASALACPSNTHGATSAASLDSGLPGCEGPGAQDLSVVAAGVWYELTLPGVAGVDDRVVEVSLSSANFDARVSVFEGNCGALTCVTANDDAAPAGLPRVAWLASAGSTYRVLVHGAAAESGAFVLELACELEAEGDDCAAAITLSGESGTVGGALEGSTATASSSYASVAACAPAWTFFDVWYELSLDCATELSLDTCGATDTVLSVHSACPSASASFEIAGACNDDGAPLCAPGSQLSVALAAGSYWIRVAAPLPAGSFTLAWAVADSDGDGVRDCSDGCPLDPLKLAPGVCGCGVAELDSDGDAVLDCNDGCPLDPLKVAPGVCGCGVADLDSDGDGAFDCNDGCPLDPLKLTPGVCGCGVVDLDSDGDSVLDCNDGCPLDPLKLAPGVCGCGVADLDSDGDGAFDCNDGCPLDPLKVAPGACGCGVAELDSDGDSVPDCNDGCPLDPAKLAPGACGCGVSDIDTDGDALADCIDNCEALANPLQEDCDFDGSGDVCELAAGTARDLNNNGQPDNCELGAFFSYCTAGTSSAGCLATISASGVFSASASAGFVVTVSAVEGQKQGIMFYGVTGPSAQPWFGASTSFKCVKAPLQRMGSQNSGGTAGACDGLFSEDAAVYFTNFPGALGAPLAAGQLFNFQAWYRDPPAPSTTNLSDALQATCAP